MTMLIRSRNNSFFTLVVISIVCFLSSHAFIHRNRFPTTLEYEHTFPTTKRYTWEMSSDLMTLRQASLFQNVEANSVLRAFERFETDWPSIDNPRPTAKSLTGKWKLIYSSLLPTGYFPIDEICDFIPFTLKSSWGPIPLGTIEGSSAITGENPLQISFKNNYVVFGPFRIPQDQNKPQKSYTFYYVDDEIAVARSSSGGYTLLKKES